MTAGDPEDPLAPTAKRTRVRKPLDATRGRNPRGGLTPPRIGVIMAAGAVGVYGTLGLLVGGAMSSSTRSAGGFALGAGLVLLLVLATVWAALPGGLYDRARRARRAAIERQHPGEPWRWDHRWNETGATVPARRALERGSLLPGIGLGLILVFVAVKWNGPGLLGSVLFLAGAALAGWLSWRGWKEMRLGAVHLSFLRFPFHPGERAEMTFGTDETGGRFTSAVFVLKRIEESRAGLFGMSHRIAVSHSLSFIPAREFLPGAGHYTRLELYVPSDAGPTRLSARFPVYWELEFQGVTDSGKVLERFLVPIYERPVAAADAVP